MRDRGRRAERFRGPPVARVASARRQSTHLRARSHFTAGGKSQGIDSSQ